MCARPDRGLGTTPPRVFERRLLQHRRFHDFDELKESAKGWDLDWHQLDRGPLRAEMLQVSVGTAKLDRSYFNRRFDQRGSSPPGTRTFGLIEERVQGTSWCRHELDERSLTTFRPGGDFEAVSPPGFASYTLSFSEKHLVAVGETIGIERVDRLLGDAEWVASCDRAAMKGLRGRLRRLCEEVTNRPSSLESSSLRRELEFEIPARILEELAISRADHHQRMPAWHVREIAVARARSFIEQNPLEPVTVQEVSRAARVSWRTLDYAFREHFGVSPKSYLKAVRLNGARGELNRCGGEVLVADAANKWGFWHMGQFAADYRKLFVELPIETLGRRS